MNKITATNGDVLCFSGFLIGFLRADAHGGEPKPHPGAAEARHPYPADPRPPPTVTAGIWEAVCFYSSLFTAQALLLCRFCLSYVSLAINWERLSTPLTGSWTGPGVHSCLLFIYSPAGRCQKIRAAQDAARDAPHPQSRSPGGQGKAPGHTWPAYCMHAHRYKQIQDDSTRSTVQQ